MVEKWCKNNLQSSLYLSLFLPKIALKIANKARATPTQGNTAPKNAVNPGPNVIKVGIKGPTKPLKNALTPLAADTTACATPGIKAAKPKPVIPSCQFFNFQLELYPETAPEVILPKACCAPVIG